MNQAKLVRKYPRLSRVVLAVTDESDLAWVEQLLKADSSMARGIINEAYKRRHSYKLGPGAYRDIDRLLGSLDIPLCQVS